MPPLFSHNAQRRGTVHAYSVTCNPFPPSWPCYILWHERPLTLWSGSAYTSALVNNTSGMKLLCFPTWYSNYKVPHAHGTRRMSRTWQAGMGASRSYAICSYGQLIARWQPGRNSRQEFTLPPSHTSRTPVSCFKSFHTISDMMQHIPTLSLHSCDSSPSPILVEDAGNRVNGASLCFLLA